MDQSWYIFKVKKKKKTTNLTVNCWYFLNDFLKLKSPCSFVEPQAHSLHSVTSRALVSLTLHLQVSPSSLICAACNKHWMALIMGLGWSGGGCWVEVREMGKGPSSVRWELRDWEGGPAHSNRWAPMVLSGCKLSVGNICPFVHMPHTRPSKMICSPASMWSAGTRQTHQPEAVSAYYFAYMGMKMNPKTNCQR